MKIALVVPGGVDRSGVQRVIPALLALVSRLAQNNEIHVFALTQDPLPGTWWLAGAQVHNIGHIRTRWRALRAIHAEHRRARFHLIQVLWSGTPGLVGMIAGKLLSVPVMVHVAGGELVSIRDIGYGGRQTLRGCMREALVLRAVAAVTAASEPMIAHLTSLGIAADRLPLGVDIDQWVPRPPRRRVAGAIARLVHVASLNPVKDQGTLLQALAMLAATGLPFTLDIVGEDTLGGQLQTLAATLGIASRVAFHGFLSQQKLRAVVEDSHLLVMASRHEAGPLALLEAAVVGVPAVGTAVGHFAEWAPHAAVAVPVGDAAALAAAISRVLGDDALRMRLASAAQALALRSDANYTAARFQAIHERIVQPT